MIDQELFEERAALIECGCKVDRATAERMATQQMSTGEPVAAPEPQRYGFQFD